METTIADYRKIIDENRHRIVNVSRDWNNSMAFYSDSIIVWNSDTKEPETIRLGIDTLDAIPVQIDKSSAHVKAYDERIWKMAKAARKAARRSRIGLYLHHGKYTAARIVRFLDVRHRDCEPIAKLLATKTFRNNFRKSLRDQILSWLKTRKTARKYAYPLSDRQRDALNRYGF